MYTIKSGFNSFHIHAQYQLDQRNVNENWVKCYLFELIEHREKLMSQKVYERRKKNIAQ